MKKGQTLGPPLYFPPAPASAVTRKVFERVECSCTEVAKQEQFIRGRLSFGVQDE
jgi:hypothetical protein